MLTDRLPIEHNFTRPMRLTHQQSLDTCHWQSEHMTEHPMQSLGNMLRETGLQPN